MLDSEHAWWLGAGVTSLGLTSGGLILINLWRYQHTLNEARGRRFSLTILALPVTILPPLLLVVQQYRLAGGGELTSACQSAIAAKRLGTLSSGISPLGPLLLVGIIVCLWALCSLRRIHQATTQDLLGWLPKSCRDDNYGLAMYKSVGKLRSRLKENNPRDWGVMDAVFAVLALGFFGYLLLFRWIGSVEGPLYDDVVKLALLLCVLLVGGLFMHANLVCGSFHEVLRRLNYHPLAPAFRRLPDQLKHSVGPHLIARPIRQDEYRQLIQSAQSLSPSLVHIEVNCCRCRRSCNDAFCASNWLGGVLLRMALTLGLNSV